MSDESLVKLAEHAEDMAANPNVPPAEKELWQQILTDISEWLGRSETPNGPVLFDE